MHLSALVGLLGEVHLPVRLSVGPQVSQQRREMWGATVENVPPPLPAGDRRHAVVTVIEIALRQTPETPKDAIRAARDVVAKLGLTDVPLKPHAATPLQLPH